MVKVGFQFHGVSPTDQAKLDRFLVRLMLQDARARRHLRGGHNLDGWKADLNRRRSFRVSLRRPGEVVATIFPLESDTPGAQDQAKLLARSLFHLPAAEPLTLSVYDISSGGCCVFWPEDPSPPLGTGFRLHLVGEEFTATVRAKVVYAILGLPPW